MTELPDSSLRAGETLRGSRVSPPPCGEGSGVGVGRAKSRYMRGVATPTPALPAGGREGAGAKRGNEGTAAA